MSDDSWIEHLRNLTPDELRELADRADNHDLNYVNSWARTCAVITRHFADLKERCEGLLR